jgi:hypothetical protein
MVMRTLCSVALLAILAGCVTPYTEVTSYTETFAPTAHVELLLDKPARPFKTFALLHDSFGGTPEEVNARLEQKGMEIGADAVWITKVNDKSVTEWIITDPCLGRRRYCGPTYTPVRHTYRSVQARAIKYLPEKR